MTQGQSQVNLLTIKQFAEVCRTTPRTLRFYEKKGLFKPAVIDTFNKYRFYHPSQAREFLKIKLLQNFHVPLKQIKANSVETTLLNRLNIWKEAKRLKLKCENYEIVFYLNGAYNPKNTPLEISLVFHGSTPKVDARKLPENFYFKKYPKTKVLTFEYNGPYEYLILV